jgi:hypothetical protein
LQRVWKKYIEHPDGNFGFGDDKKTPWVHGFSQWQGSEKIAGIARKELEKELGRSVVSKNNFLQNKIRRKLIK